MIISGEQDIQGLCHIGHIIAVALQELRTKVAPGMTTGDLDNICGRTLQAFEAKPAPLLAYGFPGQLCISVNDEVVHGIPGGRVIEAGDLVKFDLEAEKNGYIADACISVIVPPIGELQTQLAECAEQAFNHSLAAARAGNLVKEIGRQVEGEVKRRGFSVVRELCGHGVGRKVHEKPSVPNYPARDARHRLTEGLVITIEPIITAGSGMVYQTDDGWTIRSLDKTLAAHFEHTIIITKDEPIIVTAL
jgi:methionyl aminopeptidase